ncbi:MAG: alpha/beta hydrolase, partial [Salinisphaera sp.]|nr:alpha/beta hydrolase [Salinisphaera sp.]
DYLAGVKVPVLLMQGQDDEYGTAAQLDAIERQATGPVTTRWLADCGHAAHRDQPEAVIDAVGAFLAEKALISPEE